MGKRDTTALIVASIWSWSYICLSIINLDWQWVTNPSMDFMFVRFLWIVICLALTAGAVSRHIP
jgi:hypothetical protein